MTAKRFSFTALALLLVSNLAMAAESFNWPTRSSEADWQCEFGDGTTTNHQRYDTAVRSCIERQIASPEFGYDIQGGRYHAPAVSAPDPDPVPDPVNCVGSWSSWARVVGSESACVNSQRTFSESRAFTIATPPANGGAACPASPETRTASEACAMPPPPPPPGDGSWDLWGDRPAPSEFSTLAWPSAPAATNAVVATSIAQVNAAPSGSIVTLAPGTYSGTLNLARPDVHYILTGATINGGINSSASGSRVRVDGGHFISSGQNVLRGSDLHFNNVRIEASGFQWADSLVVLDRNVQRIAFVRCSLVNNDPASGRVVYQYAIGGTSTSDIIFAGTELLAQNASNPGQWAARINGASRVVIVDSRLQVVSPSQSGRYHADDNAATSGYYAARNQVIGGTWNNEPFSSTGFTGGSMAGVYFYDNDFYRNDSNGQLAFRSLGTGSMRAVRVIDNTHYTHQNGGSGNMQIDVGSVSDYQGSNNIRAPYRTPPAFAYGSDQ